MIILALVSDDKTESRSQDDATGYDYAKGNGLAQLHRKDETRRRGKSATITQTGTLRDEEKRVDSLTRLDIDIEAQSYRIRVWDRELDSCRFYIIFSRVRKSCSISYAIPLLSSIASHRVILIAIFLANLMRASSTLLRASISVLLLSSPFHSDAKANRQETRVPWHSNDAA